MIVNDHVRGVERFGTPTEQTFAIKATGKAFRILSSGLYRNKIQAIIRELSCNAYDAHVAAGCKEKPFWVHLPNRLEPWFAVRDEGIGLSREGVLNVYTTYFESTKTGSNDFIGALGLGSKSPFSYVDSFTVESRFDGVKTTYAAFINETGQPSITAMTEEPTTEANGVEVSLPVAQNDDFDEFEREASSVLSRFKVKPTVVGRRNFTFDEHKVVLEGRGWIIPERAISNGYRYSADSTAYALMGNVAYPISTKDLKSLSAEAQRVLDVGLDVEFPIGALDVTAGREELSYDKPTLAALEARAKEIAADAPALFQSQIEAAETEFAARRLYAKLFAHEGIGHKLMGSSTKPSFTYRGKTINSKEFPLDENDMAGLVLHYYGDASRRYRPITYAPRENAERNVFLPCDESLIIVLDDLEKRGAISRVNYQRRLDPNTPVVLVQRCSAEADFGTLLAATNGFKVQKVTELEKPPTGPRGSTVRVKMLREECKVHSSLYESSWSDVEMDEVDASEGGIFTLRRGCLATDANGSTDSDFLDLIRLATNCGILAANTPIYGLHKQAAVKFAEQGRWVSVRDAIKEEVADKITDPKIIKALVNRSQIASFTRYNYTLSRMLPIMERVARHLPKGHEFRAFMDDYTEASSERNDLESLSVLCEKLGLHRAESAGDSIEDRFNRLMETYPLLCAMESSKAATKTKLLAEYLLWSDTRNVTSSSDGE